MRMSARKRESVRDRERSKQEHALSFAATTDPFHIDATVNVTPVSRAVAQRSLSLPCSSPQLDAAVQRGC